MSFSEGLARWAKVALIVVGIGVLAWLVIPIFFYGVFKTVVTNQIVDGIVEVSGWNSNVVRGLTILGTLPLLYSVLSYFSFRPGKKRFFRFGRHTSMVVISVYVALYFLMIAFAGRGNFFSFGSGEALKYYAVTPEGVRFFDAPGKDPKYGIELQPATPELIESLERARLGLVPEILEITSIEEIDFFDRLTGAPAVWYARQGGELVLYSQPGVEPTFGQALRPVTGPIVAEVKRTLEATAAAQAEQAKQKEQADLAQQELASRAQAQEAARQARLGEERRRAKLFNLGERPRAAVMVVEYDGAPNSQQTQWLADVVGGSASFLRAPFARDPVFDECFAGDTRGLEPYEAVLPARVILGKLEVRVSDSDVSQKLVRVDGILDLRVIDVARGFGSRTVQLRGTAARFSAVDAEAAVVEELASKVRRENLL